MTTSPSTPDQRAKRWGTFAKIAAVAVFGFFVAPFILQSIAGLIGVAVLGVTALVLWSLLPVVGSMAANLRLKLIKAEAARNPVETLEAELHRQMGELDARKTAIGELNGEILTFGDKLEGIAARYGKNDSAYIKLSQQLSDLKRVLANREEKWKLAYAQLKRFEEEIDRAGMIWEAAQAAARAQESSGLSDAEFFAKLKTETSLDAIQTSFNNALASLDTSLMQSDAEKMLNVAPSPLALPAPDANAIELTSTPAYAKVRR